MNDKASNDASDQLSNITDSIESPSSDSPIDANTLSDDPTGQVKMTRIKASEYQGPIPSPEMLAQYDEVHKGASGTIFEEWTAESTHRRKIEEKHLDYSFQSEKYGRSLGLIAFLFLIISICISAYLGLNSAVYTLGALGAAGIIVALIKGNSN